MNHTHPTRLASKVLVALSALVVLVTTLPVAAMAHDRYDNPDHRRIQDRIQAERFEGGKRAKAWAKAHKTYYKRPPLFSNARYYRHDDWRNNSRWQQARANDFWRYNNWRR